MREDYGEILSVTLDSVFDRGVIKNKKKIAKLLLSDGVDRKSWNKEGYTPKGIVEEYCDDDLNEIFFRNNVGLGRYTKAAR